MHCPMKLTDALRQVPARWTMGLVVSLVLFLNAAIFGLFAWVVLVGAMTLAGSQSEVLLDRLLLASAIVWLPLSVGTIAPALHRLTAKVDSGSV